MLHSPLNPVSPHLHQHRHPGHSVPQYPTRCSELVISPGPMEPAAGPSPTAVSTNRVVQRRSQSPFTAHDPHSTQVMESDLDVMPSGLPAAAHLDEPPTSSQPMEASTSSHETHAGPSRGSSLDMDKMARPKRKRITPDQLETLLELFTQTDTPSYELRESVGNRLGMSNREVQVWFQNRRAKERTARQKQHLQEQQQLHRAEREALVAAHHTGQVIPEYAGDVPSASPPPRAYPGSLPVGFVPTRRRSMSTGGLVLSHEYTAGSTVEDAPRMARPPSADPGIGPIRPRIARYHTYASSSVYAHPSRARFPASHLEQPEHEQSPGRASPSANPNEAGDMRYRSAPPLPFSLSSPSADLLPLPIVHPPARPFLPNSLSLDANDNLAGRRNDRLPPIRLLFDAVDQATGVALSPSPISPSGGLTSPALASPLGRMALNSPIGQGILVASGSTTIAAGSSSSGPAPSPSYFEPHSRPRLSPPHDGRSDVGSYSFGTYFSSDPSEHAEKQQQ